MQLLLFLPFRLLVGLYRVLPKRLFRCLALGLIDLFYLAGLRRKVIEKNLQQAFPTLSAEQQKKLLRQTYHFVYAQLEVALDLHYDPPQAWSSRLEFIGREAFEEAFAQGRGLVLLTSHFGMWEAASCFPLFGWPLHNLTDKVRNPWYQRWLFSGRTRFGAKLIVKEKTMGFTMRKVLKHKEILGLVGDLNYPNSELFLPFFGKLASFGSGAFRLSLASQAPLFYLSIRKIEGRYLVRFQPLLTDFQGVVDDAATIEKLANLYIGHLEEDIRQAPAEYFWFNRRWKTRPPSDPTPFY